jgi:hypothetical protein
MIFFYGKNWYHSEMGIEESNNKDGDEDDLFDEDGDDKTQNVQRGIPSPVPSQETTV